MSGLHSPERILLLRYSALGDVILATSVLAPLRARFPEARLEWVTDSVSAPLLEGLPELDAVHRLERTNAGTLALRRRLAGRFDLAIDLQNKFRTAVLARAAAPHRLVFRRRTLGQSLKSLLARERPQQRAHATRLYAEVLAPLGELAPGPLRVNITEAARMEAEAALATVKGSFVAIAPGAKWANKRWPPEHFARAAEGLIERGHSVVLAGGPPDRDVVERLRATLKAPLAADLTSLSLPGLAAALSRASLLIANDSGPVHLATAVGTPVLALFGPTSPLRWGPPLPSRSLSLELACSPCSNHGEALCPLGHHRCLRELAPAHVVTAAEELLVQAPGGG